MIGTTLRRNRHRGIYTFVNCNYTYFLNLSALLLHLSPFHFIIIIIIIIIIVIIIIIIIIIIAFTSVFF